MRVTAIVPAYPPRSRVGAWLSTHTFLAHLASRGHNVTVVPLHGNPDRYSHDRVTVARSIERLYPHIDAAHLVVTHCGDNGGAATLAARYGKPNVRMAHGHIGDPACLNGAALVVFNSQNLARSVDCPSPWIVCHPPVDAAAYRTTPGDLVTLVNLSEAKGGELFWRLARSAPHIGFLGVLGGYGVQVRDEFPNAKVVSTTDDMREVYSRTRVLLMPSERETWGMVALEGMVSGIPVIAHPTPGLLESLGDAAMFVDRADGQGWLDAIERLNDPGEWGRWSARSSARADRLDPQSDLDRFAVAVEALARQGVPA